jgi:hypothetical protein
LRLASQRISSIEAERAGGSISRCQSRSSYRYGRDGGGGGSIWDHFDFLMKLCERGRRRFGNSFSYTKRIYVLDGSHFIFE